MAAIMAFTSFPNIAKGELAPQFPSDNNGPWTGWEDESIYFQCWAQGGTPPYQYKWEFGDGQSTDWSENNYAYHTYTELINSPTYYNVKSRIQDDEGNKSWCQKVATVYKEYDLDALVRWEAGIWFEGVPIDITCRVTIEHRIAPGFDWYAWCEIRTWPGDELVKRFDPHDGVTLSETGTGREEWEETWNSPNPGLHRAWLYIEAEHDYYSNNDIDYDGVYIIPL